MSGLRPSVARSPEVRLALRLFTEYRSGNWVAFFALVERAPYLVACLCHAYFNHARKHALLVAHATEGAGAPFFGGRSQTGPPDGHVGRTPALTDPTLLTGSPLQKSVVVERAPRLGVDAL